MQDVKNQFEVLVESEISAEVSYQCAVHLELLKGK